MIEKPYFRAENLIVLTPEEKDAVDRLYHAAIGLLGDIPRGVASPTLSELIQAVKDFQQVNPKLMTMY